MIIALFFIALGVVFFIAYVISTKYSQDNLTPEQRVQQLQDTKYSTSQSRFASERERKAAEARTKNAEQLSKEAQAVTQFTANQAAAEALFIEKQHELQNMHERLEMAVQMERETFNFEIEKMKNELLILSQASQIGLSSENYQRLVVEERLLLLKIKAEQMTRENELKLKLDEHKGYKEIDHEIFEKQKRLAADFANMNLMTPYHEMDVMNKKLKDAYIELEKLGQLPAGTARDLEMKRVRGSIEFMEKDIREREQRIRKPV